MRKLLSPPTPLSLPKLATDPLPNVSNEMLEWIARLSLPEFKPGGAPVHEVIRRMCDVLDILGGRPVRRPSAAEYQRVLTLVKILTAGAFCGE